MEANALATEFDPDAIEDQTLPNHNMIHEVSVSASLDGSQGFTHLHVASRTPDEGLGRPVGEGEECEPHVQIGPRQGKEARYVGGAPSSSRDDVLILIPVQIDG